MKETLTKQWLIDNRISIELDSEGQPHVFRWNKPGVKRAGLHELKTTTTTKSYKYSHNIKHYKVFTVVHDTKHNTTITLHRAVYAWFKGDVPVGMHVDHIDNDSLNNNPDNLRLLTPLENQRFKEYHPNQWTYINRAL